MRRVKKLLALLLLVSMVSSGLAEEIGIDAKQGVWRYETEGLSVRIDRRQDPDKKLIWYECELRCSPEKPLLNVFADPARPAKKFQTPEKIAQKNRLVFALSDDYFGDRVYNKKVTGVVIRDGRILCDGVYKTSKKYFPNLDSMAIFGDGSLRVFQHKEHTAEEYLKMGAVHVLSFGPVILRNGEINPALAKENRSLEPRVALGMVEPYHYVALVVEGRHSKSKGVGLPWVAERLKEMGAVEAMNLDGGQTAALVFMGEKINTTGKFGKKSRVRSLNSMLGAGVSETPEQ